MLPKTVDMSLLSNLEMSLISVALAKECAHIANPYLWATKSLLAMHFSMPYVIDKTFITFVFIKVN